MSAITTHVLDTARGCPAAGVPVTLSIRTGRNWNDLAKGVTNSDGRLADLLPEDHKISSGIYRIIFETNSYFSNIGVTAFYPLIVFEIGNPEEHYHVPLLLSPFGYSTYRGS
jgi:5-hydroxyisourate hydrolase